MKVDNDFSSLFVWSGSNWVVTQKKGTNVFFLFCQPQKKKTFIWGRKVIIWLECKSIHKNRENTVSWVVGESIISSPLSRDCQKILIVEFHFLPAENKGFFFFLASPWHYLFVENGLIVYFCCAVWWCERSWQKQKKTNKQLFSWMSFYKYNPMFTRDINEEAKAKLKKKR